MHRSASTAHLRLVDSGHARDETRRESEQGAPAEDRLGATRGLEDEQLVALARDGDERAFEALYRRYAGFAINLSVRIQGSDSDVEDVVHDAFLRAYHRLAELRDAGAFKSWLGSIVVHLVRSRLRRRRLMNLLGLTGGEAVDLDSIASSGADSEARAQLAQIYALLQTLPANERIAWTLRHIESHRLETVADLSGCSLATAKRRISRADRYLKEHFVVPFRAESAR